MANVVITHFLGILYKGKFQSLCFYDGIISSLIDAGHNVLHIITNDFLAWPWNGSNKPYSQSVQNSVLNKIKSFKPDIVISFNNSSVAGIDEAVDCPIAVWDADSFQFFNDKEALLKKQDRYHFFAFSSDGLKSYEKYIDSRGATIAKVQGATSVRRLDVEKTYNISFIANPFYNSQSVQLFLTENPDFCKLSVEELDALPDFNMTIGKKYGVSRAELKCQSSGLSRASLVLDLLDYGIKVFGHHSWLKLGLLDSRIYEAFDPRLVHTLEHNELIYNRSKLSFSISHKQNIKAYPWRILDIMASSSVLISEYKADLIADFPQLKFPIYHTRGELLSLTERLLNDEAYRNDFTLQCNAAVDEGFRWPQRFSLISQITGVDLSQEGQPGKYERFACDMDDILLKVCKVIAKRRQEPKQMKGNREPKRMKVSLKVFLLNFMKRNNSYDRLRFYLRRLEGTFDEIEIYQ